LNQAFDRNTRVTVFVANLLLASGETASSVTISIVDAGNQSFDVAAEDVRTVPNLTFAQVVFRLPDNLAAGSCAITVKAHGLTSNTGKITIRN
jgi:hypothetical protein